MSRRNTLPAGLLQMLGDQDDDTPSFPMKEAQADMLRQVVEMSQRDRPTFKRGDAVRYLEGTGPLVAYAKAGMVFRFWRYLDLTRTLDEAYYEGMSHTERQTIPDPDCLIACFTGREVRFDVSCSYLLLAGDE